MGSELTKLFQNSSSGIPTRTQPFPSLRQNPLGGLKPLKGKIHEDCDKSDSKFSGLLPIEGEALSVSGNIIRTPPFGGFEFPKGF